MPAWAAALTPIAASRDRLTQAEDSFVEELWAGGPAAGATLLAARFPRWFIDPNRAPDDVDPDLLDLLAPLPSGLEMNPGPKSRLGLGLIRRQGEERQPGYCRP